MIRWHSIRLGIVVACALGAGPSFSGAQELRRDAIDEPAVAELPPDADVAARRRWLRERLTEGLKNAAQIRSMNAKLDRVSEDQLDKLIRVYQARRLREQARLRKAIAELEQARALRDQLALMQAQNGTLFNNQVGPAFGVESGLPGWSYLGPVYGLGYGPDYGRRVGFAPVISWLPEGTMFQASGLISPDGRSVRVSAFPFFSSIGPVDTFDFGSGRHDHGHGHEHGPGHEHGHGHELNPSCWVGD